MNETLEMTTVTGRSVRAEWHEAFGGLWLVTAGSEILAVVRFPDGVGVWKRRNMLHGLMRGLVHQLNHAARVHRNRRARNTAEGGCEILEAATSAAIRAAGDYDAPLGD